MRVLIAAAASGGHIFPALSFIAALNKKTPDLKAGFISVKKDIENQILSTNKDIQIFWFKSVSKIFNRFGLPTFAKFINLFSFFVQAFIIMRKFKPDVVVGFGGFLCVPVILCAHFIGVPTLIHEQNVSGGLANRILFGPADKITLSFPQSVDYINKRFSNKAVVTGNPVRQDIYKIDKAEALKNLGLENKFTILVMGGSQGAHFINKTFIEAVPALKKEFDFQIIHLCGKKDYDFLLGEYNKAQVDFKLFSFLDKVNYAYNASDLIISRAGSGTIFEISTLGLASILIPYRYANRHQEINAQVLEKEGASVVIKEIDLTAGHLSNTIFNLIKDIWLIQKMRLKSQVLAKPDAADRIALEVIGLVLR